MFINIQRLALAILLTGTLVNSQIQQLPTPGCFTRSQNGGGVTGARDCAQFINNFCDTANSVDFIRMTDSVARCYNLPNFPVGGRCDFVALNTSPGDGIPGGRSCTNILNDIVNRCTDDMGGGGMDSQEGYTYSVDINTGACGWAIQAGN